MQEIKQHIKTNCYKPIYLLYGSENYLKKLYKDKLKKGILGNSDEMNYSYFEGKTIDIGKIIEIAQTLPFFSNRRLIIIENSGLFKSQSNLVDEIKQFPDTTYIIFLEKEIDKRNRLFKLVKELGKVSQMDGLDEASLKLWIGSLLQKEHKKIKNNTLLYFLEKTGSDMENISRELEKVICYAIDREVITETDIDAVCSVQITGKIFQMVDAIALGNQVKALELYNDLLILREKPLSILFLITRHFNILLHVKQLEKMQYYKTDISKKVGIPVFTVAKYITQAKNFSKKVLLEILEFCVETETAIKTGKLIDQIGVELLIVKYSAMKEHA